MTKNGALAWSAFQQAMVAWRASPTGLPETMTSAMQAAEALQELVILGDGPALRKLASAAQKAVKAKRSGLRMAGGSKKGQGAKLVTIVHKLMGAGATSEEIASRIIVRCTALDAFSAGPKGDPSVYSVPGLEARVSRAVTKYRDNGKLPAVIVQHALEAIGFTRDAARQATTR